MLKKYLLFLFVPFWVDLNVWILAKKRSLNVWILAKNQSLNVWILAFLIIKTLI